MVLMRVIFLINIFEVNYANSIINFFGYSNRLDFG
jgi:hypothetical protein